MLLPPTQNQVTKTCGICFGGGIIIRMQLSTTYNRIGPYGNILQRDTENTPKQTNENSHGNRSSDNKHHLWTHEKLRRLDRYVWGYSGEYVTAMTIIYDHDAYLNPQQCIDDLYEVITKVKECIGDHDYVYALEYGEGIDGEDLNSKSVVNPHFHAVFTSPVSKWYRKKIRKFVEDETCFDSVWFEETKDEFRTRKYLAKRDRLEKDGNSTHHIVTKVLEDEAGKPVLPPEWVGVKFPTLLTNIDKSKIETQQVSYTNELLDLFCFKHFKTLSHRKIVLKNDMSVYLDSNPIGVDDVKWDAYSWFDEWFLLKNKALSDVRSGCFDVKMFNDLGFLQNGVSDLINSKLLLLGDSVAQTNLHDFVSRTFDKVLLENRDLIPRTLDKRVTRLCSFKYWTYVLHTLKTNKTLRNDYKPYHLADDEDELTIEDFIS